jgi:putative DNA primase/helicase
MELKTLNITTTEFLDCFFEAHDEVNLRIFDDKKRGVFTGLKITEAMGKVHKRLPELKEHNDKGHGIFFVVNGGGQTDADITHINAQFFECDSLSFAEQEAQINAFPLKPSLVVKTAKSLHVYYLVKDGQVKDFVRIQKKLVARFNGDPQITNHSRVMRLPGFNHCKGEPVPVSVVRFNPELKYTQAQIEEHLPHIEGEDEQTAEPTKEQKRLSNGLELLPIQCEFIRHCKEHAAELSEHDWYAMISNLAVFEGGEKLIHEYSAAYPKYNRAETDKKIKHFLASGTGPMTCAVIAEKGFKCPYANGGECKCKAPAGARFKPLGSDAVIALLGGITVTGDTLKDLKTATEFVGKYLYNLELIDAEPLIESEVARRFGLRADNAKRLVKHYKELNKAYQKHKERDGREETPEWYEVTENGLRFLPGILSGYIAKTVPLFYAAQSHYLYENGVYKKTDDLAMQCKVRKFMIERSCYTSQIMDALNQLNMLTYKSARDLNSNRYVINLKNGLYNVLDGSISEHTPEFYSTVQLAVSYDEKAECPRFMEFLRETLAETEIPIIQEILGYLMIPINKAQKCFLFSGAAHAGKSTLLSVAQEILCGVENCSNVPWQMLSDKFKTAELYGKLANIFADLPQKNLDDNGLFKSIVGEDYITVEEKNKNPFSFKPFARLLFSCNDAPKNYGDRTDGFYRRLIIIKFEKSVPKDKRDANLVDKLRTEADGIFMWALQGLKRLMDNKFLFTETVKTAEELDKYKRNNSSALLFFEDKCELKGDSEVLRQEVYDGYKEYCNRNGYQALSATGFNAAIEKEFPEQISRSQDKLAKRKTWKGVVLR